MKAAALLLLLAGCVPKWSPPANTGYAAAKGGEYWVAVQPGPKIPVPEEKPIYTLWLMWKEKGEAQHDEYETDNVVQLIKLARSCGEKHGSCEVVVLRKDKDGLAWPVGFYTVPGDLE